MLEKGKLGERQEPALPFVARQRDLSIEGLSPGSLDRSFGRERADPTNDDLLSQSSLSAPDSSLGETDKDPYQIGLSGRSANISGVRDIYISRQVESKSWTPVIVPKEVVGLTRDVAIFTAIRKKNLVTYAKHGDRDTFCPPIWWDLGIGSGACGLGCRSCFLMLTFRTMRDPLMPIVYTNVEAFWRATKRWLVSPKRRWFDTMGLGIDRADSLLYEGITGHARNLIPIFANPELNPKCNRLVLLTKTANTHYLEGLPTKNTVVSFSLNPESIADLWEGKWPDTNERITPPIIDRLKACKHAQELGFEVRFRIDPILPAPGWRDSYADFFKLTNSLGINPRYITLGTYRRKNAALDGFRKKWELPMMEYLPNELERDGTHWHLSASKRVEIYSKIKELIELHLPSSKVSLCKETHPVRKDTKLCNADCNCLS